MKLIQINVERFRFREAFFDYINDASTDIITMQECSYGYRWGFETEKELHRAFQIAWYHLTFYPEWKRVDNEWKNTAWYWNGIATRKPLKKSSCHFLQSQPHTEMTIFDSAYARFLPPLKDVIEQKYREWKYRHKEPISFVHWIMALWNRNLHILTSQYCPSNKCAHMPHMDDHSKELHAYIEKHLPTWELLIGMDMNIEFPSPAIKIIEECGASRIPFKPESTLNTRIHPGFHNDIGPNGYMVDHAFQRWINIISHKVDQVDISDHLPLVIEFELS